MRHQHDAPVQNGRATLVDRSVAGDEEAFAELFEQHAGLGWRYAYALTGTARDAVEVTTEGFGRAFTTLRGDLGMPQEFRPLLLSTTRNAAVDRRDAQGDDVPAFETSEDMLALATAFTALPERWRSALWLSEVEGEGPRSVASILGLEDLDAAKVTARARKGLREQFLRADAAATPGRNCERAIRRLGPYVAGTLPANQTGKLERHLRLCTTCADRNQAMVGLIDRLPLLVPAVPALLEDDVRLAWAAAVATPSTGLGITAFAEKLLAGVAALSAGVGVLGAAIVSVGSGGDDEAVAPIAPIVTELAAPRPDDLDLTIDLDPAGFEGSDASSEARFGDIRAASGDGSSAPVTAGLDAPPERAEARLRRPPVAS